MNSILNNFSTNSATGYSSSTSGSIGSSATATKMSSRRWLTGTSHILLTTLTLVDKSAKADLPTDDHADKHCYPRIQQRFAQEEQRNDNQQANMAANRRERNNLFTDALDQCQQQQDGP